MQRQHFPNYVRLHENAESRDQWKLHLHHSKHIVRHREQRLRDVTVELHGDMEFE
jgi:hypothetical protein